MTKGVPKQICSPALGIALSACMAGIVWSQTLSGPVVNAGGVVKLRVRLGQGPGTKATGLSRKRFFLIKGSLEDNKALVENIEHSSVSSRDCYYRNIGASEALISWLKQSDCESVYCREVEQKDLEGSEAVPEFQHAALVGEKEFGSRELGRKWVAVNLKDELRNGYYKQQQRVLQSLFKQAEGLSKAKVQSVMTDTNGTAFFTDIEPGIYVISNLLRAEVGNSGALWNCEIKVNDPAVVKPYLLANAGNKDPRDVKNIKCVSVETPLPDCPPSSK